MDLNVTPATDRKKKNTEEGRSTREFPPAVSSAPAKAESSRRRTKKKKRQEIEEATMPRITLDFGTETGETEQVLETDLSLVVRPEPELMEVELEEAMPIKEPRTSQRLLEKKGKEPLMLEQAQHSPKEEGPPSSPDSTYKAENEVPFETESCTDSPPPEPGRTTEIRSR